MDWAALLNPRRNNCLQVIYSIISSFKLIAFAVTILLKRNISILRRRLNTYSQRTSRMATFWTCKTLILELLSLHCSHRIAHSPLILATALASPRISGAIVAHFPTDNETLKNPTASWKFTFHLVLEQNGRHTKRARKNSIYLWRKN